MSKDKMKTCAHCGAEIAAGAKVCPKCGGKNKKPFYTRPWFLVLVVLVVLAVAFGGKGGSDTKKTGGTTAGQAGSGAAGETGGASEGGTDEPEITYTAYSVGQLMDDLNGNAMKAAETYKDQYVELTGRLSNIDSGGSYIDIMPEEDSFAIIGVQCYIKNEEQKSAVMELQKDDVIVVKGKITDVGEVLGYSLNMDEVYKK